MEPSFFYSSPMALNQELRTGDCEWPSQSRGAAPVHTNWLFPHENVGPESLGVLFFFVFFFKKLEMRVFM